MCRIARYSSCFGEHTNLDWQLHEEISIVTFKLSEEDLSYKNDLPLGILIGPTCLPVL